jgi:hypothetical protein
MTADMSAGISEMFVLFFITEASWFSVWPGNHTLPKRLRFFNYSGEKAKLQGFLILTKSWREKRR